MRAVVQRVSRAEVRVDGQTIARIAAGLLVLVAVGANDTPDSALSLADKLMNLRILEDEERRMNRAILEAGGSILCVSQFTLYGDVRRGRRPSFIDAAPPEEARTLYEKFLDELRRLAEPHGITVEAGRFQAMMEVESVNDGPVTILLDTDKAF